MAATIAQLDARPRPARKSQLAAHSGTVRQRTADCRLRPDGLLHPISGRRARLAECLARNRRYAAASRHQPACARRQNARHHRPDRQRQNFAGLDGGAPDRPDRRRPAGRRTSGANHSARCTAPTRRLCRTGAGFIFANPGAQHRIRTRRAR